VVHLTIVRENGSLASTHEEIMAVYEYDIGKLSYLVEMKYGKKPFYDNFDGMQVRRNIDYDPTKVVIKEKK